MSEQEMQAKAEAKVLAVLKSADYPAAAKVMSDALGLPALLTAEAERDELKAKADKLLRMIDIAQAADDEKSEREIACSATFMEAMAHTNTEMVEQQRDQLRAELESVQEDMVKLVEKNAAKHSENNQLRAELVESDRIIKADSRQINELGNQTEQLRADLAQLRRNVGTLYELIQGNISLTGKQKEAANYIFEQLDKGVK